MDIENNKNETPREQIAGIPGSQSATAQSVPEHGAEVHGQAQQTANDVFNKTAQAVSDTYKQAQSYRIKNPGKTILLALGIGIGLGLLLGASSRPSRTGRIAKPVVNALSDIALEFFR